VYAGRRFYVEVVFWAEGTTAIHQHSFSGAFQVLVGSSIHTLYGFERGEAVARELADEAAERGGSPQFSPRHPTGARPTYRMGGG
jgi:hypothetical protein